VLETAFPRARGGELYAIDTNRFMHGFRLVDAARVMLPV
jgi:hypothetical protein